RLLIVVAPVEGERERPNGVWAMLCRKAQHGARVEPAAQVARDRHIRAQAKAHRFVEHMTELGYILSIRTLRCLFRHSRVVEVPVRDQLKVLLGREQVVPGRHLKHTIEQRPNLVTAVLDRLGDRVGIPASGNSSRQQCLHLGSEIQRLVVERVEERLDAKAVTSSKEGAMILIPDDEGKFPTQVMEALRSEILVEVERNLA